MGSPNNARESLSWGELLFDAHVQRWEFAKLCEIVSGSLGVNAAFDISSKAFARLAQAIAEGDRTQADEILRGWGIRR